MGRERTGPIRTVASGTMAAGVVGGPAGFAGGHALLIALGVPEDTALAIATLLGGVCAGLVMALASWARDVRQQTDPGTLKDLGLRLLAALGCVALLLHLPACAVGRVTDSTVTGIAIGRGALGDCSEFVVEQPEGQEPVITARSDEGWCIRGSEASDQAAEGAGNIFSSLLGLLGL